LVTNPAHLVYRLEHTGAGSFMEYAVDLSSMQCDAPRPSVKDAATLANLVMTRYARGDDAAFIELYKVLRPRLYRYCLQLAGACDAEDLTQETFLKMHRARDGFMQEGTVLGWAFAIARRTHLDMLRQRKRRPETVTEPSLLELWVDPIACDPEAKARQRALEAEMAQELNSMSGGSRTAYVLVRLHGFSCLEAAAALGISVNAVKQRIFRATEELKVGLARALT
jgi:RNA polymerase sigma-70 factor, ECF subfamily